MSSSLERALEEVWARGRRHVKISKLYLTGLLKRGPNIFVALAWSQAFWLFLEATAGNADSRGYVRLSSVACYALALHTGGHLVLSRYGSGRHKLGHHALEFLLDLVTDVVGFAWINFAEEMLAQVFEVRAKTTLMYAALAFVASLGAMEAGSMARGVLDWPVDFEETANQFDAGSFALPTSWLITQAVHIGLYGFFYRTAGGQGGRDRGSKGDGDGDDVVDIRPIASLFLLAYALLCSLVATRVIGGTVAASTIAADCSADDSSGEGSTRNDLVIQAISSYEVSAAGASDAEAATGPQARAAAAAVAASASETPNATSSATSSGAGFSQPRREPSLKAHGEGSASLAAAAALPAEATAAAEASRARQDSLRRGLKAYMRLTVGMMVGWAYNLWGQVEFRQEELEFRFGTALGAIAYAAISTALGVCIMVRGADKLDASLRSDRTAAAAPGAVNDDGVGGGHPGGGGAFHGGRTEEEEEAAAAAADEMYRDAVRSFHARRLLVVVGGVSLVVGWAWEEAFDLVLEGLVGEKADAGTVLAKLALAVVATAVVLGREVRAAGHHGHHGGGGGFGGHVAAGRAGVGGGELLEPLVATHDREAEAVI